MKDDFSSTTLAAVWSTYNFASGGPTYNLTANPGYLRITVPSGTPYDQTVGVDSAAEIRRTDMGPGNFAIETRVQLLTYTEGNPFHTGLVVRLGTGDVLLWGLLGGALRLEASRSGTPSLTAFQQWEHSDTYLRIEKSGAVYTFFHKAAATDRWVSDGQYRDATARPVASVGLMAKTWTSSGAALSVDIDYFLQVAGPTISDDGLNSGNAQSFGNICTRYVPLYGPLLSLPPNIPGQATPKKNLRMQVPGDQAYDHWSTADSAPQLQRDDMGAGDWTLETVETLVYADGAAYHSGLLVRFSRYDAYYWGMNQTTDLQLDRTGTSNIVRVSNSSARIWLQAKKTGSTYSFAYKTSSSAAWTTAATTTSATPVTQVGIITKTWLPVALAVDFGYLLLTRPVPVPGGNGISIGRTDNFATTTLDPAETSRIPLAGPTYSLSNDPGTFQWVVPNDQAYDHWTTVDQAPQLRRTDMGGDDWVLETKARLLSTGSGAYHGGLLVGFGTNDCYYWGFSQDHHLQLDRSGTSDLTHVANTSDVVYLRVTKTGSNYEFAYRTPSVLTWTVAITTTGVTNAVQFVGIIVKTWLATSIAMSFDYLDVVKTDNFSGTSVGAAWTAFVPVAGPAFTESGGALHLAVPNTRAYDAWTAADDAPQLRRADMGSSDWSISTRANTIAAGSFQTGLFVRFGEYDQFYWGFDTGATLQLDRSGSPGVLVIANRLTAVHLRIEKVGSTYLFFYRPSDTGAFRLGGVVTGVTNPVTHVGLFTKTWNATNVSTDFDYFTLQQRTVK